MSSRTPANSPTRKPVRPTSHRSSGSPALTQSINCEERAHGIRACAIFPGDIDTPLLDRRPQPPTADARARMLQPDDVAACVLLAVNLPERAVVEEILIRPRG
jgi:NADP-dependent 3-hydroxy acid dehydrogenase YdfG